MKKIDIQNLINDFVRKENEENKRKAKNWHSSSLGSCLRGQYLKRLGVKPDQEFDDRTLRVFSCGKIFENWVVEILKKQKSIKIKTQVRAENKDLDLSGYADLILSNKKEGIVYELKSKNSKSFWYMADKGEGAMKQHQLQLFSYLYMLGFKEGKIVYIEKDTLSILEYPVLLSNRELEKEFLDELNLLNTAWKLKDPKILPLPKKDNWKGRYCQYHKQCVNL